MNKIKCRLIICIVSILVSMIGITCYASTSDELYEQSLTQNLIEQYGADYETPFIAPGGNVSLSDGNVNINEVDMSLPGRNGMDVNIRRTHYVNGGPVSYSGTRVFARGGSVQTSPMYVFTYVLNGNSKTIYVAFDKEEDLVDSFYAESSKLNTIETDAIGKKYYKYSTIKDTSGVLFTRDKSKAAVKMSEVPNEFYTTTVHATDIEIGYGWYVSMPQLTLVNKSEQASDMKYKYLFKDENGQTMNFSYLKEESKDSGWIYKPGSCKVSDSDSQYTAQVYDELQTHSLGFNYDITITDGEGKTYYYEQTLKTYFLPAAIIDRYGNAVRYTSNADGSVTIVDTYGRNIHVSQAGITVSNGNFTKSVEYSLSRVNSDRDPYGLLDCYSKYILNVKKYNGVSYETTEYVSHKSTMLFVRSGEVSYYDKIEKVTFPTNASVEYEYETVPTVKKFASSIGANVVSHCDYHINKEKVYEDGSEKYERTYSFEQASQKSYVDNKERSVTVEDTYDDGSKKSMTYSYDYAGRLFEKSGQIEGKKYTEEYKYSYTSQNLLSSIPEENMLKCRKAYLKSTITTYDNNMVNIAYNEYNSRNLPTYTMNGELESLYTYDNNYGILLSKEYQKDSNTKMKVSNTITADGKSILKSEVFENGSQKTVTSYTYNSDGTIASQTVTPTVGEPLTTEFGYTYNPDGSFSITTTVNNVKDNDGSSKSVTTVQNYDWLGNLTSSVDAMGNTTVYWYDNLGRVIRQINPDETNKKIDYNVSDNSVTVTDENGYVTTKDYSPLGYMDKIYFDNDLNKLAAEYKYDNHGRKVSETAYQDIGGKAVKENYTYDQFDRIKTQTSKEDDTVLDKINYQYSYGEGYQSLGEGINIVNVPSNAKKLTVLFYSKSSRNYDAAVQDDNSVYFTEKMTYGKTKGTVVDVTGLSQIRISAGYSGAYYKFLTDEETAQNINLLGGASQTVTATYTGDETYVKPTVETVLDGFGNKVSETYYKHGTDTVLNKNTYKYDYAGNVTETLGGRTYMENLGSYTSKAEYNYMGKPTKVYQTDGSYVTAEYDDYGNALTSTDYEGNTTTVCYDILGRAIACEAPFDETTTTKSLTYYDANGNVIKTKQQVTASSYTETENEYDNRNRLVSVRINDGERDIYTQYAYDGAGNVVKMVTGQTSKIEDLYGTLPEEATYQTYEYDRFGNVTKATDALGQDVISEYNLMGLPTKQTDKNGNETVNTYNAYGSVLTSKVTGDEDIINTYSKNNLLISTKQGKEEIKYTYDDYGYMKTESQGNIQNTYSYDVNGNRKNYTQKAGTNTILTGSYTYDILDRLIEVDYGTVSAGYMYNANGRLTKETRWNITSEYTYNKAGLVTEMKNSSGQSYTYSYNLAGNQTVKASGQEITNYGYDGIGQLITENVVSPKEDEWDYNNTYYQYDTRGNRILKSNSDVYEEASEIEYKYDKNNRLKEERETNPINSMYEKITSYEYDNNGNILFKGIEEYDGIIEGEEREIELGKGYFENEEYVRYYSYNGRNQLIGMKSDKTEAIYKYDPIGRRESKTVNGKTTTHRWDGSNIVSEAGENPTVYYMGINLIAQKDNAGISYYQYNAHGDITGLENTKTKMLTRYEYDAFGGSKEVTGTVYGYNGQYTDKETGLIYLRNRYYDPETGRFTQEDPVMDGLNWYAYCGNNPVNFFDPSGLESGYWYKDNSILDESLQYTEQEQKNMDSAIQAYKDGFLSEDDLIDNIISNNGIIPSVGYEINGNNVNIIIRAEFSGDRCDEVFESTGKTYKQLCIEGIEEYWSGEVDGITINTKVIEFDKNKCKVEEYKLLSYESMVEEAGEGRENSGYVSHKPGKKTYIVDFDYHKSQFVNRFTEYDRYQYVCVHETGHGLRLGDLHDKGKYSACVDSIMWGNANYTVSNKSLDLRMLLVSVSNKFNKDVEYSSYPDIMDKYSPDWRK